MKRTMKQEVRVLDFTLEFGDFYDTTVKVVANTSQAKAELEDMFGQGAVSFEMPKSQAFEFERWAEERELLIG